MFGIGMPEMILILAIALIVLGPKKLPDLAKSLGRAMREFKKATSDFKESIETDTDFKDVKKTFDDVNTELKDSVDVTDSLDSESEWDEGELDDSESASESNEGEPDQSESASSDEEKIDDLESTSSPDDEIDKPELDREESKRT